ncbi:DUF5808 domain-containing protein [Streptomyces sp. NPDC088358]|uniref:DUF5808 domain-containing protein n=1 Tax=Streptomyces sp. NPDC088358 TaxID=3365857 RepID=UPI0038210E27
MDQDVDHHWFGFIYWSRDDQRLTVPKRYGWGRTLNFARPMAWFWILAVPAVASMTAYLSGR